MEKKQNIKLIDGFKNKEASKNNTKHLLKLIEIYINIDYMKWIILNNISMYNNSKR